MVSIPKVVGVVSCGFLLGFGLSNAVSAADDMSMDQSEGKGGQVDQKEMTLRAQGVHTIQGHVMRVEYGEYVVKEKDGKEVRVHTDKTTQMMGQVKKGDRIVVKVDDQNHALSMLVQ